MNRIYLWTPRVGRLNNKVGGTENTLVTVWIMPPPTQIHMLKPSFLVWLVFEDRAFKEIKLHEVIRRGPNWMGLVSL